MVVWCGISAQIKIIAKATSFETGAYIHSETSWSD